MKKLRVAVVGREDTTTHLFFFRCTTTAELRREVRLSVAASFSTCSLNTCSGEPWLAGRPCLSRTDLPCSDAVYAERNTSRPNFQTKNEPQRRNTLTWKMFLILRSYQTTGQNHLDELHTICDLWSEETPYVSCTQL